MRKLIFLFLFIITISSFAKSSFIDKLGIEQGLSNDYILGITQDKDGFLWFATEEGLNKFDGTHFIPYYKHTGSISANELNNIYADPEEPIIWIATQRAGLNAFNYEKNSLTVYMRNHNIASSLITNDVTSVSPASDGNLWLSTYHGGVDYFNKYTHEFTHYNVSTIPDMMCNNVWCILDDAEGQLYIGYVNQGMSVLSLKDKKIKNYKNNPSDINSIPGNDVRCFFKDRNKNIWVGTDGGLALFNPETGNFIRIGNNFGNILSSAIFDIRQTDDNHLWIATELNGVAVIDLKQQFFMSPGSLSVQHYNVGYNKYSLSSSTVRCIFQDSYRNMWLGTYGGGINFIGHSLPLFDSYGFSPIPNDSNSLNNRVALSLCIDEQQRIWIGTDGGGVNIFDKGQRIKVFNSKNTKIGNNTIQASFKDSENNIWLGAFWGGVYHYDSKEERFSQVRLNVSLTEDVRSFYEDTNKNIWIGTTNGIFVLNMDNKQIVRYYNEQHSGLPENMVRTMNQDSHKRMWIGTFGHGLAVFSEEMEPIKTFNNLNDFCSNTINYIYKDSAGHMWIATGEGLVCFYNTDSLNYKVFGRDEGLNNTHIRAVIEDTKGNIWFSTNAGISCCLKDSEQIFNYNYFDKIPMGSFTNNAIQDKDGIIYFGSNNGVWYFNPDLVLRKREAPPAVITEMNIFQSRETEGTTILPVDKKIALSHKANTFNIKFNIQDYSLINQVDYDYMLKGFDESWSTTRENNITYRNIPPGNYVLQIRTRIRNQDWSENITTFPIQIEPPFWLSWQAKIFYFLFIALIVLYILRLYKNRIELKSSYELEKKNREQEQELNNERLRFYTNIAHELRTPLTLILGPLEDLQKDSQLLPKQSQKISVVRQSALRLLNLINQILEFRKTETQNKKLCVSKGNIASLIKEISLKYKELNTKPNISFTINIEKNDMPLYFDKEIVTIIVDNLLSNAIKYTDKGQISLSVYTIVRQEISYTEIMVEDTGYGIPAEEQSRIFDRYYQAKRDNQVSGTGIGLALVKNLVALHEGQIRVESKVGKGSSFIFSLLTHNIYTNALHCDEEKEEEIAEEIVHSENLPGSEKPFLLVVEDNSDIQNYIKDSFSDLFEVITASEGEEGCRLAFSKTPDIIVSDIMMPGMNGITFCKIVKEDVRTSHIPVILLTAKDSLEDKEEGYSSGADSYITKPFSASLLHSRINNLLEARRKLASQFGNSISAHDKNMIYRESLNKLDNEFIMQITQLIEANLESDKINISFLSEKLAMSSSTLFRKVKALTGISTNEFIRKIKMKHAEKLLLTGRYTVSEISFKIGISSPVYFRQCFKEEFGVSPTEYLKKSHK